MIRGLYTAGTGMVTQMKKMDIISNNLANAETNGFKEDSLLSRSFEDMLIKRINSHSSVNGAKQAGLLNTGIHADSVYTSYLQGAANETGISTDLMIEGKGFFVVQTPEGERYTRDGSFELDNSGRLVTGDGNPVLGEKGEIFLPDKAFSIKGDAGIYLHGEYIDTLRIAEFTDYESLKKTGCNRYEGSQEPEQPSNSTVVQGFLEGSNVDMAKSMVNMIEVFRNYESNQRIIKMLDGTLAKTVNEIGKI